MPLSKLAHFADFAKPAPLRLLLVRAGAADDLSWSALIQPLRLAAAALGPARCRLDLLPLDQLLDPALPQTWDMALLVADADANTAANPPPALDAFLKACARVPVWGGVGAGVWWLLRANALAGVPVALPWALHAELDSHNEQATLKLYQLEQNRLSCIGAAASLDFALSLIEVLFGPALQGQIKETLCVERVRSGNEQQHVAQQSHSLQPKLSEAVQLMQANIEEPLSTDDIAQLVGLSRRQLERLFKQHLNNMPSRYYLELRLQRSRQLLLESHHSIVQIGLMCGFSSGSHFSTAFGMLFGITPREERQRRLQAGAFAEK